MKTYIITLFAVISTLTMNACNNDDNFESHTITSEIVLKDFIYLATPQQPVTPYNQVIKDHDSWAILLETMGYEENEINVTIQNLQIGTTTDNSQPFEIVKIPKSDKPVVFEEL